MMWYNLEKYLKILLLEQIKARENIHKMWMPSKESIINQCKEVGFISHAQVDLRTAYKEYQYLYIFQKPE